MDGLYRSVLVNCYIERKKNVAVMVVLPYEIAQFKRIKKRAVLALATEMGIVVRKNN
ncbi:transcriptional regulator [Listeria seeligeri]|nr:transcriptional regulator [Listeria seeligeri]QPJ25518.1 transcriptional regulator [Listeria seeligeri]